MILKKLIGRITATDKAVRELSEGSIEREDAEAKLYAYTEIWNWIKTNKDVWAKRRGTANRVFAGLRHGYEATARLPEYNTTADSIKASIFQADNRIRKLIGFDVIRQIDEGNIKDALRLFRLRVEGKTGVRELFPAELVGHFPPDDNWVINKVSKKEIIQTLQALRSVSITYLADILIEANKDCLATILYTLSCNSDIPAIITLQSLYISYLKLEIDFDELTERLKEYK